MSSGHDQEMVLESKEDLELAKTAQRELEKAAQRCIVSSLDHSKAVQIAIVEDDVARTKDGSAPILLLPPKVLRLFANLLGTLAQGKGVAVMPKEADVTTQQAAMLLNVSRPYFIKLLDEGKIPHHKVGTHRRVLLEDVVKYRDARKKASKHALQQIIEQSEELGLDT